MLYRRIHDNMVFELVEEKYNLIKVKCSSDTIIFSKESFINQFRLVTDPPMRFLYKNWKGQVGLRSVHPIRLFFGQTQWHSSEQWLLEAFDLDKRENRTFALFDVEKFL